MKGLSLFFVVFLVYLSCHMAIVALTSLNEASLNETSLNNTDRLFLFVMMASLIIYMLTAFLLFRFYFVSGHLITLRLCLLFDILSLGYYSSTVISDFNSATYEEGIAFVGLIFSALFLVAINFKSRKAIKFK